MGEGAVRWNTEFTQFLRSFILIKEERAYNVNYIGIDFSFNIAHYLKEQKLPNLHLISQLLYMNTVQQDSIFLKRNRKLYGAFCQNSLDRFSWKKGRDDIYIYAYI